MLRDGTVCCQVAFAIEEGFNDRYVRRLLEKAKTGVSQATGGGGARIRGVHALSAAQHDSQSSIARMHVSAWFSYKKMTAASIPPNEEGGALYQIDRIEHKEFYKEFRVEMSDLVGVEDDDIASRKVWAEVWKTEHPDLAMRAHMNVDSKDKVSLERALF
jgi:hypothetical protein